MDLLFARMALEKIPDDLELLDVEVCSRKMTYTEKPQQTQTSQRRSGAYVGLREWGIDSSCATWTKNVCSVWRVREPFVSLQLASDALNLIGGW
jgi:hypothetical protein